MYIHKFFKPHRSWFIPPLSDSIFSIRYIRVSNGAKFEYITVTPHPPSPPLHNTKSSDGTIINHVKPILQHFCIVQLYMYQCNYFISYFNLVPRVLYYPSLQTERERERGKRENLGTRNY